MPCKINRDSSLTPRQGGQTRQLSLETGVFSYARRVTPPCPPAVGFSTAGVFVTGSARAANAEGALRSGLEPRGSDRLAAAVAAPVAALLELRERSLQLLLGHEQAVADADLVAPADRLVRAVADALAEADAGARLRRLRELGDAGLDVVESASEEVLDSRVILGHRLQVKCRRVSAKPV